MNPSNVFNIEYSLNDWLNDGLGDYVVPSSFSGFPGDRLILTMPEAPVNAPVFSCHHLFIEASDLWQGRRGDNNTYAVRYEAFMDVSAWVSRLNANWVFDLRWMASILSDLVNKTPSVQLTDYITDPPNTWGEPYRVYVDGIEARQTTPDPNPDFERQRYLIKYHSTLRSNRA